MSQSEIPRTETEGDATSDAGVIAHCMILLDRRGGRLSPEEIALIRLHYPDGLPLTEQAGLPRLAAGIRCGRDPLGVRIGATRRSTQPYPPPGLFESMARWAGSVGACARIVDLNASTTSPITALAAALPQSSRAAIISHPLAALALRTNLAIRNQDRCTRIVVATPGTTPYLPPSLGVTVYLGYGGEDDDGPEMFRRLRALGRPGDTGMIVSDARWLDSSNEAGLRRVLATELGLTHIHWLMESRNTEPSLAVIQFEYPRGDARDDAPVLARFALWTRHGSAFDFSAGIKLGRTWLRDAPHWSRFADLPAQSAKKRAAEKAEVAA